MKYNVIDFGAIADGETLCTQAVQKAVDFCNSQGGGVVEFGAGKYVLSTIFLKSNVHLHLADGAELLGSLNFYDYAQQEKIDYPIYQDASHTYFDLSMFVGRNCDDIAITGKAIIDMRSVWDEDGVRGPEIRNRGPKCIALKECNNLLISDIDIQNATDLAIYFAGCENVDIHGVKMYVYIDGISPDNCKNVKIYDCDVEAGDDGIVFKSSYTLNRIDVCRNMKVWNCRIKSRCNALKFGTETNGDFENISITGCVLKNTRRAGIAIESVDGANIRGVVISNITMYRVSSPIFIRLGARMRAPEGTPIGSMRDITLSSIYADYDGTPYDTHYIYLPGQQNIGPSSTPYPYVPIIMGIPDHPIENLMIRDVCITVPGGVAVADALPLPLPEKENAYPDTNMFGWEKPLPAACLMMRHVRGYRERNLVLRTREPDERPLAIYDDVE